MAKRAIGKNKVLSFLIIMKRFLRRRQEQQARLCFAHDANGRGCQMPNAASPLQMNLCMFGRKKAPVLSGFGAVDGGEGRGVPLGGRDERPPTGYRSNDDPDREFDPKDPEMFWEDGDPADRRRDPLRKP